MNTTQKNNIRHFGEATAYVLLLVFFTYSVLFASSLQGMEHFLCDYQKNQSSLFALVTNFGLLFLLLIDNSIGKKRTPDHWLIQLGAFVLVGIFTYGHAKVVTYPEVYSNYEPLLKMPHLFVFLHLLLIGYLIYIKYQMLKEYEAKTITAHAIINNKQPL